VSRRIWAKPQPILTGGALKIRVDDTRLDNRRSLLGVYMADLIEVLANVDDDTVAYGVAIDRSPRASHRKGNSRQLDDIKKRMQLIAVPRPGYEPRNHAV
jgi:hypothetical protein